MGTPTHLPITLGGALTPFRNGCRAGPNAFHRANPSRRIWFAATRASVCSLGRTGSVGYCFALVVSASCTTR
jgi:hypothetical protein